MFISIFSEHLSTSFINWFLFSFEICICLTQEEKTKPKKGKKDKSKDKKKLEEHESEEPDPTLNAEVNDIYEKIDSYTRIVRKTARDMIPKAITLYIIKELINYINKDLLVSLLAIPCEDYVRIFIKLQAAFKY